MKHLFTGISHIIKNSLQAIADADIDRNDICIIGCGVFVILGFFNPWFLCIAFIALLPSLNDQLKRPRGNKLSKR